VKCAAAVVIVIGLHVKCAAAVVTVIGLHVKCAAAVVIVARLNFLGIFSGKNAQI
jgi:hypothetical protein